MSNIIAYKKPLLAVIEEKKKIRDYSDEEKRSLSYKTVNDLLLALGVGKNSDTEQHIMVIKYIMSDCGKYTFEELQQAFKMAIKGDLQIDLFQQLNVLVVAKVIKLYDNYKNEKLRNYRLSLQKEKSKLNSMTEEEKKQQTLNAVRNQFKYFLENRVCDNSRIYVYDILDKANLMPKDVNYKKSIKNDAISILKNEYLHKKASSREENTHIKNVLLNVEKELSSTIIMKCKELALEDFMRKEIKTKNDIDDFIKNFKF